MLLLLFIVNFLKNKTMKKQKLAIKDIAKQQPKAVLPTQQTKAVKGGSGSAEAPDFVITDDVDGF